MVASGTAAEHAVGGGVGEVLGGGGREGSDHKGGGGPAGDRGNASGGVVDEEHDGDRVDHQAGGQGARGGHDRQEARGEEGQALLADRVAQGGWQWRLSG